LGLDTQRSAKAATTLPVCRTGDIHAGACKAQGQFLATIAMVANSHKLKAREAARLTYLVRVLNLTLEE
jgi:hypothetical protein